MQVMIGTGCVDRKAPGRQCANPRSPAWRVPRAGASDIPSPTHPPLVTFVPVLPGEVESAGQGMVIEWGLAESPFGFCSLGWNTRGICHLAFHDKKNPPEIGWAHRWRPARFLRSDKAAAKWSDDVFFGGKTTDIPVFVVGTSFQLQVWRELLRIPFGGVTTYAHIATAIGNPGAVRAVGTACGANPVAWLIPCHRVIRQTGGLGGYRWGTERKRIMLAVEGGGDPPRNPWFLTIPACQMPVGLRSREI